jgi:SAM-dependent methyltransferase
LAFLMTTNAASTQFSDPRLVAIFDTINSIDGYGGFYLELAGKLAPKNILDIGCGTGLLICELAKRGFRLIGLDPAAALLDQARRRKGCEGVRWVLGYADSSSLSDIKSDLALMTGHVAQFFLEDDVWGAALRAIHEALTPGGHLAFETRNPLTPAFAGWPTEARPRVVVDPIAGDVSWWFKILRKEHRKVQYELHYRFGRSGEEVVSTDELIFRSRDEVAQSLIEAGFSVAKVFGDWDRSALGTTSPEMIFVAQRP